MAGKSLHRGKKKSVLRWKLVSSIYMKTVQIGKQKNELKRKKLKRVWAVCLSPFHRGCSVGHLYHLPVCYS